MKIGDLVSRKSYNNDLVFKITDIVDDNYILYGVNIRLIADAKKEDLQIAENRDEDLGFLEKSKREPLDREDYFYLPGKILHIDSDKQYLKRCIEYYDELNVTGILKREDEVSDNIASLLREYNPNILVITGHDAYNDGVYKNSQYYIEAVKEARKYEHSHEKLIIIAGGCQSNYGELIKAGANFASSPKCVNIHALDPAIIASSISLASINADIDLKGILDKTKYGIKGMGGIRTKGTMYVGYPR